MRQGIACAIFGTMFYFVLTQLLAFLLDLIAVIHRTDQQKDLQILILRHQLRILQCHHPPALRISPWEKLGLAALVSKFTSLGHGSKTRLDEVLLLFKPDTVLKWHRELVRRKWSFTKQPVKGRPTIDPETQALVLQLAKENPTWEYSKIHGELLKLGFTISRSTVCNILKQKHIPTAPERTKQGSSWSTLLKHYGEQILACDFFIVETAWLKTLYALFFIEISTRRVHFAGCTSQPTAEWVTQQARQLSWTLQDEHKQIRFLLHDRDTKFTPSFDRVFTYEGIRILKTPYRTPVANAHAERWVRSVREECLDRLLIMNEAHLRGVLMEYTTYYNQAHPHQGIEQRCPIPFGAPNETGPVKCRNVLGGVIHDYYHEAA